MQNPGVRLWWSISGLYLFPFFSFFHVVLSVTGKIIYTRRKYCPGKDYFQQPETSCVQTNNNNNNKQLSVNCCICLAMLLFESE